MRYRLFHELAHRFDLHTPPSHYQHDQEFVLKRARQYRNPRLLDVGCGTGALLRRAQAEGISAQGIDASAEMIAECDRRLGPAVARALRMEWLADVGNYDVVSCMSWSLNYLADEAAVADVLARFHRALVPGGALVLQVAHAANATGEVYEDWEPGPQGEPRDVLLLYRFQRAGIETRPELLAQYVYVCFSAHEAAHEDHVLRVADAEKIARLAVGAGFRDVTVADSWREDPFGGSVMPFVTGRRP